MHSGTIFDVKERVQAGIRVCYQINKHASTLFIPPPYMNMECKMMKALKMIVDSVQLGWPHLLVAPLPALHAVQGSMPITHVQM
jgi:hypothetical protein